MAFLNDNYFKLKAGYLFPEIGRRVRVFTEANPDAAKRIIRCGIGDVTEPLPPAVTAAMHKAVDDMATREGFHGYGPEQGYEWLRHAIAENDYRAKGLEVADDEVFVSDGSKCDCGNVLDILGHQNIVAITDPVYPVYVDTNVMAGHTGEADESGAYAGLVYLNCTAENGFVAAPPAGHVDVIYLCFPNNPTGAVATRAQLEAWVAYAREHQSVILYDAAYEAYISNPDVPHSIYEIAGAREVAIEFRSFSKNGGFTGTRCAFIVVPKTLLASTASGERKPLHPLWLRRHTTKFNGVSYIVQRGAEALYSAEGQTQVAGLIAHYMGNEDSPRSRLQHRPARLWRRERALHLVLDAGRDRVLGNVRPHAPRGQRRHHAGERLRRDGRGLLPHQRVQLARQCRGSRAPDQSDPVVERALRMRAC